MQFELVTSCHTWSTCGKLDRGDCLSFWSSQQEVHPGVSAGTQLVEFADKQKEQEDQGEETAVGELDLTM